MINISTTCIWFRTVFIISKYNNCWKALNRKPLSYRRVVFRINRTNFYNTLKISGESFPIWSSIFTVSTPRCIEHNKP
ncbi:unnamed protein product [Schistosoma margrebowiei]|uniref:Uncharacterized protein n=1 Tax=Schistosoma margrebowiei TaxID=48269 RepID=A0A183LEH0_9TREM|nr:unnamed protein product [Schistosoma margrebowiei]